MKSYLSVQVISPYPYYAYNCDKAPIDNGFHTKINGVCHYKTMHKYGNVTHYSCRCKSCIYKCSTYIILIVVVIFIATSGEIFMNEIILIHTFSFTFGQMLKQNRQTQSQIHRQMNTYRQQMSLNKIHMNRHPSPHAQCA